MPNSLTITAKQAEYVREAHHRWNFAVGAVRSGKSHIAIQYVIPNGILSLRGRKGLNLILGASKENIERNVLAPMRDIWGDRVVSEINSRNIAKLFGERVYCLGAENKSQVSKIRGSEVKFCYCDEVCDIHPEVFEMLKSRLSLPYSQCHAACNPAGPEHFVKKFIDSAGGGIDIYVQNYQLWDNPFLSQELVSSLEAEYEGTVYYDRYILGLWTKAEGLVYPMYAEAFEEGFDRERAIDWCVSCDYGTQNAFAALKWAFDGQVWHCVEEYRYSGRDEGHQKTNDDYMADMVEFCRDIPKDVVTFIIDPSAVSFSVTLRRCKERRFKILPADNAVADGLQDTAVAIKRGLIRLDKSCVETKKEFVGYVWDEKSESDKPVKENDHCMDALRYFVKTKRLVVKKQHQRDSWLS